MVEHRPGSLHSNADAVSRMTCKQCWGKVAPTVWIDECERADKIVELLSLHALRLLPEFPVNDLVQLQAEDPCRRSWSQLLMHVGRCR